MRQTFSSQFKCMLMASVMVSMLCVSCRAAPSALRVPATAVPAAPADTTSTPTAELQDSPAARAIERYVQARVAHDANTAIALSCGDWEKQARIEVDSLRADASLEGLTCRENGAADAFTLIACSGKILTSYNGETRELDLSRRQFRAVLQSGEWLMCGYH